MVNYIQRKPSFLEELGGNLGKGFSSGMERAQDFSQKMKLKKDEAQAEMDLYNQFMNNDGAEKEIDFEDEMMEGLGKEENDFLEKIINNKKEKIVNKVDGSEGEKEEVAEDEKEVLGSVEDQRRKNDFSLSKSELPKKTRKIPAIGKLAPAAKLQHQELKENKKENKEYSKNHANLGELRDNERALQQAHDLIHKGKVGPDFARKTAIMLSSGKISEFLGENFKKIFTTPDEQKLAAIMMKFARPKDIGGSNPSTREVLLALERYPDILNHPEANRFLIDEMLNNAKRDLHKGKIISSLNKYDPSMEPAEFKDLAERKTEAYEKSLGKRSPLSNSISFNDLFLDEDVGSLIDKVRN